MEGPAVSDHSDPPTCTIGEGAFSHCVKLITVSLPRNLKLIQDCAFFDCPALQTINNLESTMVARIGESAFEGCVKLDHIGVPYTLEEIADHAFSGCSSLERGVMMGITQASKLKTIGQGAFEGCKGLRGALDLTGTILEEIQADAFKNCICLREVRLNAALTDIESNAFAYCVSLQQVIFHPSGHLTNIGPRAFQRCDSIEFLEFPASLESIDYEAFSWCFDLVSVQFQNGLSSIAEGAFGCCELRHITIPSSVEYLAEEAFNRDWLYRIEVDGDRLELSIRLWRMHPYAYVGMSVEQWCNLYVHTDKRQLSTLGPADMEKLEIVKGWVADKLYRLVLWSVSIGSIGT